MALFEMIDYILLYFRQSVVLRSARGAFISRRRARPNARPGQPRTPRPASVSPAKRRRTALPSQPYIDAFSEHGRADELATATRFSH